MNRADIDALPAVVDVCTAARVMGLSRNAAYELVRTNSWPTPVFRLGKLIRIPTAPMRELLGIDSPPQAPALAERVERVRTAG